MEGQEELRASFSQIWQQGPEELRARCLAGMWKRTPWYSRWWHMARSTPQWYFWRLYLATLSSLTMRKHQSK